MCYPPEAPLRSQQVLGGRGSLTDGTNSDEARCSSNGESSGESGAFEACSLLYQNQDVADGSRNSHAATFAGGGCTSGGSSPRSSHYHPSVHLELDQAPGKDSGGTFDLGGARAAM